jgi:adenine-specific DNA-methyltransferase
VLAQQIGRATLRLRDYLSARQMGSLRYIGSKARVVDQIIEAVGAPTGYDGYFVDLFSGTGVVSREAGLRGWRVRANDHLLSSSLITQAQLVCHEDVPFQHFGGYLAALMQLTAAPVIEGFITAEYSPGGHSRSGHARRYFTTANAKAIDGMRAAIRRWREAGLLAPLEEALLLADLLLAVNGVANTAGTYGCFLNDWDTTALKPIQLSPRLLLAQKCDFVVSNLDSFALAASPADVVYIDPPYTKRQYAAYYHLLETISAGDSPVVGGVTGLRPWEEKSSPFCYKRRALKAFESLLTNLRAERIFISYSAEGHVALADLSELLSRFGVVETIPLGKIGRYRPNEVACNNGDGVSEFLISLNKTERSASTAHELSCYA